MASSTSQTTANRKKLHRQAMEILNTNSFHLITISLLFLPLTFSTSVAIQSYFDQPTLTFIKSIFASYQTLISIKYLIVVLAFTIFIVLPAIAGVALITYSTNQAIHHKPLIFYPGFRSLSRSYIPLVSTIVAGSIKLILISLFFTLSGFATTEIIKSLRFLNLDQFTVSICINTITLYAIVLTVLFFIVIWGSAAPISVLESKVGFEPLQQSANQSTKFRYNSFSIVYLACFVIGSLMMYNSVIVPIFGSGTNWGLVLKVCVICLNSSMMILHYAVANTVLYVQYKAARGEGTVKTAAEMEVSGLYDTVAVDDEDEGTNGQPSKAVVNGGFNYMCYFFIIFYVCSAVEIFWRILLI